MASMGKKKGSSGQKQTQKKSSVEGEVIDILADLLDNNGLLEGGENESNPWLNLSLSLDTLAVRLEKLEQYQATPGQERNEETDALLLSIESASQEVLELSKSFPVKSDKLSENLTLCQELESTCNQTEFALLVPLSMSLSSSLRSRRLALNESLYRIPNIISSTFPRDNDNGDSLLLSSVSELRDMSARLKSRFIDKDKAPWKEARDYLLALAKESQESEEEFEGDEVDMADEGQSTMDPLIDETSVTVDKDLESLKAKLPDSDVCRFVFEVLSERKVSTSCMLVGPPGSGKTHTCDEIERTFGSAVDGE